MIVTTPLNKVQTLSSEATKQLDLRTLPSIVSDSETTSFFSSI